MNYYCGIGSRTTPNDVMVKMIELGIFAVVNNWILRSGGAHGADSAFEYGCNELNGKKEIYLPWAGFNGNTSSLVYPSDAAFDTASTIHPAFKTLTPVAKSLLARNMHQVLGKDLNTPVRCVICWTPDGCESYKTYSRNTGGTGSVIALASKRGIPVFNLYHKDRYDMAINFLSDPDEMEILQL